MKILIIDSTHPLLEKHLSAAGFDLTDGTKWSEEEILKELSVYDGVVIRSRVPVNRDFFEAGKNLKCIGRFGAGLENIDPEEAKKHGVTCFNVPEGNRQSVAEHSLALLLNLMNHIRRADTEVRDGLWQRHSNTGLELSGKTVGIIGLGNMGQSFARVLRGFDVEILGHDPYIHPWPMESVTPVDPDTLLQRSDVISLHVPLTEKTRGMVNRNFFDRLGKPIFLINTARGQVLRTEDLLNAIADGKVLGAGLDVLEFESRSFGLDSATDPVLVRLLENDQVLLTPHVGGWTKEAFEKMAVALANKMIAHLS